MLRILQAVCVWQSTPPAPAAPLTNEQACAYLYRERPALAVIIGKYNANVPVRDEKKKMGNHLPTFIAPEEGLYDERARRELLCTGVLRVYGISREQACLFHIHGKEKDLRRTARRHEKVFDLH